MHSDPDSRRPSKPSGLHIVAAIVVAAMAITLGISLGHPTRAHDVSPTDAVDASPASPAAVVAPAQAIVGDPSLPAAAEALRPSGGAAGDDATTF